MKTITSTPGSTKGKVVLITMLLLIFHLSASASESFGSDEPSGFSFHPAYSYLALAGVIATGILIFTFFKHREEKHKRTRRSNRQVHFNARYSKQRMS